MTPQTKRPPRRPHRLNSSMSDITRAQLTALMERWGTDATETIARALALAWEIEKKKEGKGQ